MSRLIIFYIVFFVLTVSNSLANENNDFLEFVDQFSSQVREIEVINDQFAQLGSDFSLLQEQVWNPVLKFLTLKDMSFKYKELCLFIRKQKNNETLEKESVLFDLALLATNDQNECEYEAAQELFSTNRHKGIELKLPIGPQCFQTDNKFSLFSDQLNHTFLLPQLSHIYFLDKDKTYINLCQQLKNFSPKNLNKMTFRQRIILPMTKTWHPISMDKIPDLFQVNEERLGKKCLEVTDQCAQVDKDRCNTCPNGFEPVVEGICLQTITRYCRPINCGQKDTLACFRGKVMPYKWGGDICDAPSLVAYCQAGLTPVCHSSKKIICQ